MIFFPPAKFEKAFDIDTCDFWCDATFNRGFFVVIVFHVFLLTFKRGSVKLCMMIVSFEHKVIVPLEISNGSENGVFLSCG